MSEHIQPDVIPPMPNMAGFFGASLDDQGIMIVTMIETMIPHFSDEMFDRLCAAVVAEAANRRET